MRRWWRFACCRTASVTFGATLQQVAWPDVFANLTVGTGFNVVLTFFVVAAYLDHLCRSSFAREA